MVQLVNVVEQFLNTGFGGAAATIDTVIAFLVFADQSLDVWFRSALVL
jgi:hypothetical protein